jgi:hypothetical protein
MSDIADESSTIETMWTDQAIRQAHVEANSAKIHSDRCLWCGEPTVDAESSFCSYGPESCATDYNRQQEIRKKQGLAN